MITGSVGGEGITPIKKRLTPYIFILDENGIIIRSKKTEWKKIKHLFKDNK